LPWRGEFRMGRLKTEQCMRGRSMIATSWNCWVTVERQLEEAVVAVAVVVGGSVDVAEQVFVR
jgi:hypothetical protein